MYRHAIIRLEFETEDGTIAFPELKHSKAPDSVEKIGEVLGEAINKLLATQFFKPSHKQNYELSEVRDKLRLRDERIRELEAALANKAVEVPDATPADAPRVPPPSIEIPGVKITEHNAKNSNKRR